MAFIVQKAPARWELRESIRTDRGARSSTLATFDRLNADVLARAAQRAKQPFDPATVLATARRSGVPTELDPAEQAARTLAAQLADGATISPALAGVLNGLLARAESAPVSHAAEAAAAWADASPREHGDALHDLLLLADALPAPRTERPEHFPVLRSVPLAA